MVNPDAVIILCDIVTKHLERGAIPIAISALQDFMRQCERGKSALKGKYIIQPINSQQYDEQLTILKINEIIKDRNERFA